MKRLPSEVHRPDIYLRFEKKGFVITPIVRLPLVVCVCVYFTLQEKKAPFFLPLFGFSLSFYKAGRVTCFLIKRSNNFDKSFRLPAQPLCWY